MTDTTKRPPEQIFAQRLTVLYLLALGTVAVLCIVGQVLIQQMIGQQQTDGTVINVAGRQRMLSQKISKAALALQLNEQATARAARQQELAEALEAWLDAHDALVGRDGLFGLAGENSPTIQNLFAALETARIEISDAARALVVQDHVEQADTAHIRIEVERILAHEPIFLRTMDAIVLEYEIEATMRVERLRRAEWILLATTLLVLLLEALFIFRPVVASIRRAFAQLAAAEREREEIAAELSAIFDSVPALILYHDKSGKIIRVNRAGAEIIGESLYKLHGSSVYEWFPGDTSRFEEEDAAIYAHGKPRLGLLHAIRNSQGDIRWLRMNKVPYRDLEQRVIGIIIFAVDVSAHKRLERRLMELRANEERRLGYDLHDGVGQQLSGILYLVRRLEKRLRAAENAEAESAAEVIKLVKDAVEMVRDMSKGLSPLGDEPDALSLGLAELAKKTREQMGLACHFEEEGPVLIFEREAAEHLYRIAQEAVNNAIRHSEASEVTIRLSQGDDETLLEVSDNGIGLPAERVDRDRRNGRDAQGLGLGIMEHRAALLGADFELKQGAPSGLVLRCRLKL